MSRQKGWYLGLFGWLRTSVHELGHAFFCIVFGHKITDLSLFSPNTETGTLGYVKHSYNRENIYQLAGNFFIGIGPILLGTAIIVLLAYWLLGLNIFNLNSNLISASSQLNSWDAIGRLWHGLWSSFGHLLAGTFSWASLSGWHLYLFIYLALAISSSITLSLPDIKAALSGFGIIAVLIFLLNLATAWAGNFLSNLVIGISGYYILFFTIVLLIFLVNLAVALLILLPLSLWQRSRSKAI